MQKDSIANLNQGNILFIEWVSMKYKTEDQFLHSIHFWDSSP